MVNGDYELTDPFSHLTVAVCGLSSLIFFIAVTVSTPLGAMLTLALFGAAMQLSAMWAVLGPASYLKNSFWSLLGTSIIGLAALFGCVVGTQGLITFLDAIKLVCFGPIIWCIAQLPYWAIRLLVDWQIGKQDKQDSQSVIVSTRIGTKDLMAYTVFFALSLALIQFGFSPGFNYTGVQPEEVLYQFLIQVLVISLITFLVVCLPAMRLLFSPDYSSVSLQFFLAIQAIVFTGLFLTMFVWDPRSALLFVTSVIGFSACISILIGVHRSNGLVLGKMHRTNRAAHSKTSAS